MREAEARGKITSLRSVTNLLVRPLQSNKPSMQLGLLDWRKREEEKISLREITNLRYNKMAEVAGFEPVRPLRAYTLSKRAP